MNFDQFESELRNNLRRKEPAKGFTERVIQRAQPKRQWVALAVAASLVAGTFGVVRYEETRKAEYAKEQLMLALHITAKTLDNVERRLNEQ